MLHTVGEDYFLATESEICEENEAECSTQLRIIAYIQKSRKKKP